MRMRRLPVYCAVLVTALVLPACGGNDKQSATPTATATARPATAPASGDPVAALEARFVQVVDRVSPKVVLIETEQGLGSGVVFDHHGNVVTNAHVVGSSKTFQVIFADGHRRRAMLVSAYRPDDLAVIRLEGEQPAPAVFGDSSKLKVGEITFAVGNPLGLRSSVTQGIVSSVGRTLSEGPGGGVIAAAIQTSAPINPGNSGGALVNLEGEVIGIPTLAATDPNLGSQAPGIGFAIPSGTVKRIAGQIVRDGRVTTSDRAYLGVQVATSVDGSFVVIAGVERGGPAARAGLRPGEVITAVDGHPMATADDLSTYLAGRQPGQKVRVELRHRDGSTRTVEVTLGRLPASS
jgi:S1-C subfamily serine protease